MLYEFLYPLTKYVGAFNLLRYVSFRAIFAALTAFFVCVVVGPGIIRQLRRARAREPNDCPSPDLVRLREGTAKDRTPSMGGTIILLAFVVSLLLFGRLDNLYVVLGIWTVVAFSLVGAVDDWMKLTRPDHRGMRPMRKLRLQALVAAVVVTVLWLAVRREPGLTSLQMPIVKEWVFDLGPLYLLVGFVVIVGTSNGVNFTDGMDGLAIGGVAITSLTFLAIAYITGWADVARYLHIIYVPGASELAVFLAAVVGAGLGFLWFNCFPAQVFMGDTGSLALGAALGYVAFVCRQEMVLLVAGLMFVADGISVILQIASYRLTGRKLLPFAPLSNWWILRGQHEVKVTIRYWIVMALMGALSLVLLKVR